MWPSLRKPVFQFYVLIIRKENHISPFSPNSDKYNLFSLFYPLKGTGGRPWVPRFFTLKMEPARGCSSFSSELSLALWRHKQYMFSFSVQERRYSANPTIWLIPGPSGFFSNLWWPGSGKPRENQYFIFFKAQRSHECDITVYVSSANCC